MANFFPNTGNGDIYTWIILIVAVILGTKLFGYILERFVKAFTIKTRTTLDDRLLEATERSLMVSAVIIICYLATADIPFFADYTEAVKKIFFVITVFGAAYVFLQFFKAVLNWYGEEIAEKTETELDDIFVPILNKISWFIVFSIALTIVLANFGISITPILASFGVAGVAVALALKDTLAEFFAGMYMMTDRPSKKGDLIQLDSGEEGIIENIGWRTSRIRTSFNTVVVVPNSKLANSTIKNYEMPNRTHMFKIKGGVSYESDLDQVEKILKKVTREVLDESEGGVKDYEPTVHFTDFGDSNIDFVVVLEVENYFQRIPIIHKFIKRTKIEFEKAGIDINYPARKIYYAAPPKKIRRRK